MDIPAYGNWFRANCYRHRCNNPMNGLQFLALAIACAYLFHYFNKQRIQAMTKNTNPVLDAFRESFDPYDPWGSAISAHFDIAETLYRYGVPVPTEWQFSPSPALHVGSELMEEDASYFAEQLDLFMREGHVSNIIHAGNVLMRYTAQCELAGKSY